MSPRMRYRDACFSRVTTQLLKSSNYSLLPIPAARAAIARLPPLASASAVMPFGQGSFSHLLECVLSAFRFDGDIALIIIYFAVNTRRSAQPPEYDER